MDTVNRWFGTVKRGDTHTMFGLYVRDHNKNHLYTRFRAVNDDLDSSRVRYGQILDLMVKTIDKRLTT